MLEIQQSILRVKELHERIVALRGYL